MYMQLRSTKILYILIITVTLIVCYSCGANKLPKEKLYPVSLDKSAEYAGDSLIVYMENSLHCPMRFLLSSENEVLNAQLKSYQSILLTPLTDSIIVLLVKEENQHKVDFGVRYGDVHEPIKDLPLVYPFLEGKGYRIVQGNNSRPTHHTVGSRYAIDFSLAVNDTICSASDGYVIGAIDGYMYGGSGDKWKSYGNYVLIYDPASGRYFQYGHLVHQGSLVKQGDKITAGQPIALAGLTGQTTVEHLHFNCFVPTKDGKSLQSHPVRFESGVTGKQLKRGNIVRR